MFSRANSLIAGQPAGLRFPGISLPVSFMYIPITVAVRLSKIQYEIYARLTNYICWICQSSRSGREPVCCGLRHNVKCIVENRIGWLNHE